MPAVIIVLLVALGLGGWFMTKDDTQDVAVENEVATSTIEFLSESDLSATYLLEHNETHDRYAVVLNDNKEFTVRNLSSSTDQILHGSWKKNEGMVELSITEIEGEYTLEPYVQEKLDAALADGIELTLHFNEHGFIDRVTHDDEEVSAFATLGSLNFDIGSGDDLPAVRYIRKLLIASNVVPFSIDADSTIFDNELRKAIVYFQETQGLVPNGVVNKDTLAALLNPDTSDTTALTPQAPVVPENVDPNAPVVYFTFDDGPHPTYTPQMLAVLDKYDVKATFFELGSQAEYYPSDVRAVVSAGHYVANHTYDHQDLVTLTPAQVAAEVETTRDILNETAGDLFTIDGDVYYVRPPYGSANSEVRAELESLGNTVVMWSIDPQDWRLPGVDAIVQNVLSNVTNGSIVLMHDAGGDRSQTVAAVDILIPELQAQGYRFETIDKAF